MSTGTAAQHKRILLRNDGTKLNVIEKIGTQIYMLSSMGVIALVKSSNIEKLANEKPVNTWPACITFWYLC